MKNSIVPLLSVCDFKGGSQPPKNEWIKEPREGYIRMLQIRDFTQGNAEIEYVKIKETMNFCIESDILIARYGASIGKIVSGLVGTYNVALIKAIPNEDVLSKKYLYYFLKSNSFQNFIHNVGSRAAQAGFNKEDLKGVDIFLPSLTEQEKIVVLLDKVNKIIVNRQSQITALDELTQSLFLEMFGDPILNNKEWDIRNFDEFAIIDTKMTNDFDFHADQFHIGIDNIEKNTGRIVNLKRVSESTLTSGKYIFNSNHVIYSKIRPYLNKVALPNFSGLCSADAYPLLPKENKCTRHFLAYILRSDAFLNHVSQNSDRTNIPKVNKKQLQLFNGILPPVELQLEFEDNVREIENKRNLLIKALKEMNNLYNSLLQKAFKGELF